MTLNEAVAALKSNRLLSVLTLDNSGIDDEGAETLATALLGNRTLTSLHLNFNQIAAAGAKELATVIKDLRTLTSFMLGFNNLGPEGAKNIAITIKGNPTLASLHLSFNEIGDAGAIDLAIAIKGNQALTTLNLHGNRIGPAGAKDLANAIKDNHTLTLLYLYSNKIGDAGAKDFSTALKDNHTLTSLYLGFNYIGPAGAKDLANLLKINHTLATLDLSLNTIGDSGINDLATALIDNQTLTSLDLNGIETSHETLNTLDKINLLLKRNQDTQAFIQPTLALIENLNASQPNPFDQPEQSIINFKNTRDKLDALNYPKRAIGYIKIQTAITLMEAKHAENQGDYDTAIEKLSTLTSSNPYFKIAQTALVDMAMRLLGCTGDNDERYALIKKAMASVADSNQQKKGILNILKDSEAIAAGEKATPPLYAYHSERSRSIDGTNDQSDDLKPEAKKPSSNQN